MRIPTTLAAGVLALSLLVGACSDDDSPVQAGDDPGTTEPDCDADCGDGVVTIPDGAPDLRGTITSVEPFVPVTEDCTPAGEVDPDGAVASDDPPICTPEDNDIVGTILVEETPLDRSGGRKISYTVTTTTAIAGEGADGTGIGSFDRLAEGQMADTWVLGDMCAESYPEQCGLEAIRITG
jgi:hypothetical protein